MDGPTLQTERLTLRPPRAEDLDAFAAMCADADVMTWLGGAQSRPVAWRTLCGYAGQWALFGCAMFMVFRRDTGASSAASAHRRLRAGRGRRSAGA